MEMGQALIPYAQLSFVTVTNTGARAAGFPGCVVNVGAGEETCPTEKQESFRVRVSCTGGRSVSALAPVLDAGFVVARIADDEVSEAPRVQRYSPNGP